MSILSKLFLTPEERHRAKVMAGDAVRLHGFGAEDKLAAGLQTAGSRRERRIIRLAIEEATIWHARFEDPDYSPENYRLESSI